MAKKYFDHHNMYLFTNCLTRGAKSGGTWDPKCLQKAWIWYVQGLNATERGEDTFGGGYIR